MNRDLNELRSNRAEIWMTCYRNELDWGMRKARNESKWCFSSCEVSLLKEVSHKMLRFNLLYRSKARELCVCASSGRACIPRVPYRQSDYCLVRSVRRGRKESYEGQSALLVILVCSAKCVNLLCLGVVPTWARQILASSLRRVRVQELSLNSLLLQQSGRWLEDVGRIGKISTGFLAPSGDHSSLNHPCCWKPTCQQPSVMVSGNRLSLLKLYFQWVPRYASTHAHVDTICIDAACIYIRFTIYIDLYMHVYTLCHISVYFYNN